MLYNRGYVPLVNHGQVIVFAAAMVGYFTMLRCVEERNTKYEVYHRRGALDPMTTKMLRILFAAPSHGDAQSILREEWLASSYCPANVRQLVHTVREQFRNKHPLCAHREGCVAHTFEVRFGEDFFNTHFHVGLRTQLLRWLRCHGCVATCAESQPPGKT